MMRNIEAWKPSKFEFIRGRLRASPDRRYVATRSRVVTDAAAAAYERAIKANAHGTLADVGCGRVPLYQCYADLVDEVICIDWQHSSHDKTHIDYLADLNDGLPLADADVDTVIATDVLEHLWRPERFWAEVARVLRPGGVLILGVPFLYWLHEEPHDHFRFTRHRLARYCAENDLTISSLEAYGGPISVVFDLVGKNAPAKVAGAWARTARGLLRIPSVRRADQRRSHAFPLGYCVVARKPDVTTDNS